MGIQQLSYADKPAKSDGTPDVPGTFGTTAATFREPLCQLPASTAASGELEIDGRLHNNVKGFAVV
jgi:hypothetical protein